MFRCLKDISCQERAGKMTFLILEIQANSDYMGTYRKSPEYYDTLSDSHLINRLWEWYVQKEQDAGGLNIADLHQARELVSEYKKQGLNYNIIEIADRQADLQTGRFIGYDLSYQNHDSMLSWGLKFNLHSPLIKLAEYYFGPKLNRYGLFDSYEDVFLLFEVLKSIHQHESGIFEPHLDKFNIVAIGIVFEG